MMKSIAVWASMCVVVLPAARAPAQGPSADEQVVVAKVGDEPIYAAEVSRLLEKVSRRTKINPAALPALKAQTLAEVVDRRLVLAYADRSKTGASPAELDAAWGKLKASLAAKGSSIEQFLKEQSMTEADLRRQVAWNVTWDKYLVKYVTDARVEEYFNSHRRELDGSELSVSHILLRPKAGAGPEATAELRKQAQSIRQEISAGKLSFGEAAKKYSAGPSAEKGGDLGLISRHGPMVESFSRAAFALEVGQVSELVTTPFGVHLIRCNEIKPGKKTLGDVRKEVDEALARELLEKLAQQQRPHTPVEFTGKWPHFQPGTRELAVP